VARLKAVLRGCEVTLPGRWVSKLVRAVVRNRRPVTLHHAGRGCWGSALFL